MAWWWVRRTRLSTASWFCTLLRSRTPDCTCVPPLTCKDSNIAAPIWLSYQVWNEDLHIIMELLSQKTWKKGKRHNLCTPNAVSYLVKKAKWKNERLCILVHIDFEIIAKYLLFCVHLICLALDSKLLSNDWIRLSINFSSAWFHFGIVTYSIWYTHQITPILI